MIKKITFLVLFIFLSSCSDIKDHEKIPNQVLYLWLHDIGFTDPNFLAIVNADPSSKNYGKLINTVPVKETVGMAHHTPIFLPSSGIIFANDFHNSFTYVFDTKNPLRPELIKSFGKLDNFDYPHSYSELPNGNIISTFQTKGGIDTVGGLVEFDKEGNYLRSSSAEPSDPSIFVRPYGIILVPRLNKIITTNYDMHETGIGYHIQIWDMTSLELLHTIQLPKVEGMAVNQNPFEGRLLADGKTVMLQTFSCGLFVLDSLDEGTPKITHAYNFAKEPFCSLPVRLENFWIQTVASDNGGFNGLVVLDVSDPYNPVKVDSLVTGENIGPHWLSPNASGEKIVMTGFFQELEKRIMILNFNKLTGKLSLDEAFGEGDNNGPGLMVDIDEWPHGKTGAALAHGAIFWPPAPPDWN